MIRTLILGLVVALGTAAIAGCSGPDAPPAQSDITTE